MRIIPHAHSGSLSAVMAGLDPAIHVFLACASKDVDARHKAGHDDLESSMRVSFI